MGSSRERADRLGAGVDELLLQWSELRATLSDLLAWNELDGVASRLVHERARRLLERIGGGRRA